MTHRRLLAPAALAALTLTACGSVAVVPTTSAPSAPARASAPRPAVRFLAPRGDASVGSTAAVRVRLRHFTLAPGMVGMSPVPGRGHLHFTLDGGRLDWPRYSGANGRIAQKLGVAGRYSPAVAPTITYSHLPRGRHTLVVMLANNNHTSTGVEATTRFTVR